MVLDTDIDDVGLDVGGRRKELTFGKEWDVFKHIGNDINFLNVFVNVKNLKQISNGYFIMLSN